MFGSRRPEGAASGQPEEERGGLWQPQPSHGASTTMAGDGHEVSVPADSSLGHGWGGQYINTNRRTTYGMRPTHHPIPQPPPTSSTFAPDPYSRGRIAPPGNFPLGPAPQQAQGSLTGQDGWQAQDSRGPSVQFTSPQVRSDVAGSALAPDSGNPWATPPRAPSARPDMRDTRHSTPAPTSYNNRPRRPLPANPNGDSTPLLSPTGLPLRGPRHGVDSPALPQTPRPPSPPREERPVDDVNGGVWLNGQFYVPAQQQLPPNPAPRPPFVPFPQHAVYMAPPAPPPRPPPPAPPPVNYGHYYPAPARRDRAMPSTDKNEMLRGGSTYAVWALWVKNLHTAYQVYSHISQPNEIGLRPSQLPTYPPAFGSLGYEDWWVDDDLARHIILSRLDAPILKSLPIQSPINGGPVTARELWETLYKLYGAGSMSSTLQKWNAVLSRRIAADKVSDLPKYMSDFKEAYNGMVVAGERLSNATVLVALANAIPESGGLAGVARDFRNAADSSQLSAAYHPTRAFDELDREISNYLAKNPTLSSNRDRQPKPRPTRQSKVTCEHCGKDGHEKKTCWSAGGGAEGKREEMLAAMKERRGVSKTTGVATVAAVPVPTHAAPPVRAQTGGDVEGGGHGTSVDTNPLVAGVVSVPQFRELSCYVSDPQVALALGGGIFPDGYEHLLDSGCSLHLFRDSAAFWDYVPGRGDPMTTANCGELETEGKGMIKLRVTMDDGTGFILKMSNCRHAPNSPANLLSVGALQLKGIGVNYSPDGETYISFDDSNSVKALRYGTLSFLKAEIVYPPGVAAASFRKRSCDAETWHRRMGHLGMADTRRVLLGSYATGISYSGELDDKLCPPCVVAKGSRQPAKPTGKRASRALELVHIDLSGPYETHSKTGAYSGHFIYYVIMLDDWSNYGHTVLLKDRSGSAIRDAFHEWRGWMEKWTGCRLGTVRMDGAKELIKGAFGDYLKRELIVADPIIPYSHWQNGKAERYIQTLDNTGRSMLADSLLPPSYWGDAILTAQYLRNRLPTSTLPRDTTPYERVFNEKPDLSHLRVFGCLGLAHVPEEKRRKGGHRREPVIMVGYHPIHKAWWTVTPSGSAKLVSDVVWLEDKQGRLQRHLTPTGEAPRSTSVSIDVEPEPTMAEARAQRLASLRSGTRARDLPPVSLFMVMEDGLDAMTSFEVACDLLKQPVPGEGDPMPEVQVDVEEDALEYVFVATRDDPLVFTRVRKGDLTRPPETLKEAMSRQDKIAWVEAMKREIASHFTMGTFELVDELPKGKKAIPMRWVFAFKYDELGGIKWGEEKARLVVLGCHQRPGDYGITSSPVANMRSIKALLAWAAKMNWSIFSFDIKTAFLHALLREVVYVGQIPGFPEAKKGAVYRLRRALYGLKQSAYEFYLFLKESLGKIGVFHCDVDRAVFVGIWSVSPDSSIPMPSNGDPLILMVPVHVDDGLATTNSDALYTWFIRQLSSMMEVKDLGHATMYLGVRIIRDRPNRRLWLSQRAYISDLLNQWGLGNCNTQRTPLIRAIDDPVNMSSERFGDMTEDEVRALYLRLVGALLYLSVCTRPDLSYAVMALAQFSSKPTRGNLAAAKGVLRYLSGTADLALQYPAPYVPNPDRSSVIAGQDIRLETCGISDADWASDPKDRKSVGGFAVYFLGSCVSWSATKQRVVSLSSNESELYALSHLSREILWFRMFLRSLRLPCPRPFPLFADNQSTIAMVHSENISGRSKHIDVRHHFIRDHIKSGALSATWLSTSDNTADIFTKSLAKDTFILHRTNLGLVSLPSVETSPNGTQASRLE